MADPTPLLPEHWAEYPPLDEELLAELQALDDLEAGTGRDHLPGQDPNDVYKMKELINEKPADVIQYLEEAGVIKLGEFEMQDTLVLKAFGKEPILTTGYDQFDGDWEDMWRERLTEHAKAFATPGWSTSMMLEAHVINIRDPAAEGMRGLLHPLLMRYQARGCTITVFALPAVQAIIHFKWTTWAKRFLLYELGCYITWLLSFTTFSVLFEHEQPELSCWQLLGSGIGFASLLMNGLALLAMLPFLYMEVCTIVTYRWGWVNLWNTLDVTSYINQVAILVFHLQRSYVTSGWYSVLISVQHVLMWTKLHYFARVFNPTKTLLAESIGIVIDDTKWIMAFLGLTMLGFGFAFYSLFRQDRANYQDFSNIWHSMASMFSYLLAMFDYNVLYQSSNPVAAMLLFMLFELVTAIIMLNIMIASMTSSFTKVQQDEGLRFLCSKAQIIDELESTLPRWIKSKSWYPPFVHIIKPHPASTYEVNLNSVWSGIGLMENNLLTSQQETRLRIDDMEDKLAKVNRKLDVMIRMMMGLMGPVQLHSTAAYPPLLPLPHLAPRRGDTSPPSQHVPHPPPPWGHTASGGHQRGSWRLASSALRSFHHTQSSGAAAGGLGPARRAAGAVPVATPLQRWDTGHGKPELQHLRPHSL